MDLYLRRQNAMISSCMILLNTNVKNATSNVTRVVTIDIIYRISGSLTDKGIICNVCRTNPVIIIIIIIQYTIRICSTRGFCSWGFVQRVLSRGFCPGGLSESFVRGLLSVGYVRGGGGGGGLSKGVLSGWFCLGAFCPRINFTTGQFWDIFPERSRVPVFQ